MGKISMVMFDLSGTTVYDDTGVRDSLYKAAVEFKIKTTPDEIMFNMGTNKIHLYQFLIARQMGKKIDIEDFEKIKDPETYEPAKKVFDRYQQIMLDHYRTQCKPIPGAEDTFRWCHDHGIKVATDTGFHSLITDAIMDSLGWLKRGLVDLAVDVEDIPGEIGRPAPFMLFHAMTHFNVQSVHEVIKVGDTPADMLSGRNAGVRGVVGVLSGPRPGDRLGQVLAHPRHPERGRPAAADRVRVPEIADTGRGPGPRPEEAPPGGLMPVGLDPSSPRSVSSPETGLPSPRARRGILSQHRLPNRSTGNSTPDHARPWPGSPRPAAEACRATGMHAGIRAHAWNDATAEGLGHSVTNATTESWRMAL